MKLVVLERDAANAARIESLLRGSTYEPHAAKDAAQIVTMASAGEAPMVLVSGRSSDAEILSVIRTVRREATQQPFLLLMSEDATEEYWTQAFDAGIDGALRSPCGRPYLMARLQAARRFVKATTDHVPAPAAAGTRSAIDLLTESKTFRGMGTLFQNASATFLNLPVTASDAVGSDLKLAHAVQINLASAADQIETRIAIGVDARGARDLSTHLFGPEEDLAEDMMKEVANILMGALKSGWSAEQRAFTGGLPAMMDVDHIFRSGIVFRHQEAFSLLAGDARIVVHVGLQSKANAKVGVSELREGMIVAKDVFNPRGLMLISAGTRLSGNMIERVRGMLSPKAELEVASA